MRLATFVPPRAQRSLAGEVRGEHIVEFGEGATVRGLLGKDAIEPARGRAWPLAEVRLLAPVPDPIAAYGIGLNYAAHAAETGAEPPEEPIVFAKMSGSVAPPDGPVVCPPVVRRLDYEGELCVVIGAGGRIGGYTVADDVSARDLQGREAQWVRAKSADTFCPYGPWITTADAVPDPQNLRLRTWVNGEERQNSSTSDLIFGPQECADYIAETCTLHPGDLILTGTPSGVGMVTGRFLKDGDVVRIEIEELGVIEHRVISR
jgi:acylpyruvate hydrolase